MDSASFKEQLCSINTWFLLEPLAWKSSVTDVQVAAGNMQVRNRFRAHTEYSVGFKLQLMFV